MISDLYFSKVSDYSEEYTGDNESFHSITLQPFQFEPEQEQMWGSESQEEETNFINIQLQVYYMLELGNLD